MIRKRYIVRLTDEEYEICHESSDKLSGIGQKARWARGLCQVDADGRNGTAREVEEAFRCRTRTVENACGRCVLAGFPLALKGRHVNATPVPKLLDGDREAPVTATPLGPSPVGCGNWFLPLLAPRRRELGIMISISHETLRRTLERAASRGAKCKIG